MKLGRIRIDTSIIKLCHLIHKSLKDPDIIEVKYFPHINSYKKQTGLSWHVNDIWFDKCNPRAIGQRVIECRTITYKAYGIMNVTSYWAGTKSIGIIGKTKKGGSKNIDEFNELHNRLERTKIMTNKPHMIEAGKHILITRLEDGDNIKIAAIFHDSKGEMLGCYSDGKVKIVTEQDEAKDITLTKVYIDRIKKIIEAGKLVDDDDDFVKKVINILGVQIKFSQV